MAIALTTPASGLLGQGMLVVCTSTNDIDGGLATVFDSVGLNTLVDATMLFSSSVPAGTPIFIQLGVGTFDSQPQTFQFNTNVGSAPGAAVTLEIELFISGGGIDSASFATFTHDPFSGLAGLFQAIGGVNSSSLADIRALLERNIVNAP